VKVHAGDTGSSPLNTGSFSSRTMIAAAGAVEEAATALRDKTLRIAAHRLGVAPEELVIEGQVVHARDDHKVAISLAEAHTAAIFGQGIPPEDGPGLEATSHWEPEAAAFAFGSAAAVVSVDVETGDFDIERFVFVHDSGTLVNPVVVEGQARGALAQGFGAALAEELSYDPETGQLVNGSMLDYFVPTAADLPEVELQHTEVPSPVTPFGVRGAGETGTIPPAAAIANAICDALVEFGVELSSLPITPEAVWRLIADAAPRIEDPA
jgi:carbon-monoxide dehydrogenase large subunit